MVKDLNDKNLLKNLLKAVRELTEILKKKKSYKKYSRL